MARLARGIAVGAAVGAAALAAAGPAAAESAVWLDATPSPVAPQIGVLYNVKLFNNGLYDIPFYQSPAGTRTALFGEVSDDAGSPAVGSRVYIYALRKGAKKLRFVKVVRAKTHGAFKVLTSKASIETAYVAFAVGNPGRANSTIPAISNPVYVRVSPRITMPSSASSSGSYTIAGHVSPAPRGASVQLWRLNGRKPKRVAKKALAHNGRFSFGLSFGASGEYDYGVLVLPKARSGYVPAYDTIAVQVAIPAPAPPPPPPVVAAPPAASGPPPSTGSDSSSGGGFGGTCTAFGCSRLRLLQLEKILQKIQLHQSIRLADLPKPDPS